MTFPEFTTMPIAGEWRAGRAGKTSADTDPWSGQTLTEIPLASAEDLDVAFRGAAAAQRDWAAATPADRAAVLLAAASVMEHRKDEITGWLVHESGGTLAKAGPPGSPR
jgi:aldehyde dehydrogenase (NAD+)